MKKFLYIAFLLGACSITEKKNQRPFAIAPKVSDEWATYEGRWRSSNAVIHLELSLKNGAPGIDSFYDLKESIESDSAASGCLSQNTYSTYPGIGAEFGILLHGLSEYNFGSYFRFRESHEEADEIFLVTRGNEELVPYDNQFKPLTTDWHYTLHKRSKPFTVEGYFTFEEDSATFFERNTSEHWMLADLGEYEELKHLYSKLAVERYEGVYLKGLAYSIVDANNKPQLVLKRLLDVGANQVESNGFLHKPFSYYYKKDQTTKSDLKKKQ